MNKYFLFSTIFYKKYINTFLTRNFKFLCYNNRMEKFIELLENWVGYIAAIVILALEIVGIFVIVVGAFKAIYLVISDTFLKKHHNVKISLGNSLTLGLEFKMGAEIIKTVIVRNLQELFILGAIILLRAILALIIHVEIKAERKDEIEELNLQKQTSESVSKDKE